MKKLKVLAAALAMAFGVQAHAAVTPTSDTTTGGSLMLVVWNSSTTYARNLGIKLSDMLNLGTAGSVSSASGPSSSWTTSGFSFTDLGTSLFTSTFGAIPSITGWNIVAAGTGATGTQQFVTTVNTSPTSFTNGATGNSAGKAGSYFSIVGGLGANPATACTSGTECTFAAGSLGDASSTANWNNNFGGAFLGGTNAGTSTASSLTFEWFKQASSLNAGAAARGKFANSTDVGHWTLASNGTATYAIGAPAVVPIPGALWLLGSGLFGLAAVARRRKNGLV